MFPWSMKNAIITKKYKKAQKHKNIIEYLKNLLAINVEANISVLEAYFMKVLMWFQKRV